MSSCCRNTSWLMKDTIRSFRPRQRKKGREGNRTGRELLMSFSCSEQRKTVDGKNAIFRELANRAKKSLSVASDKNAVCLFFHPPFFRTKSSYLLLFLLNFFSFFVFLYQRCLIERGVCPSPSIHPAKDRTKFHWNL